MLTQYNPKTNPNAPAIDGHNAGTYLDGTVAYVGIAHTTPTNNYCNNEVTVPARVTTKAAAPGAYGECATEMYDGVNPWYMKDHPGFKWVPATTATVPTIPYRVTYDTGTNYFFVFGRMVVTSLNGTKYTVVSKVHLDHFPVVLFFLDETNKVVMAASGFEVLTCQMSCELKMKTFDFILIIFDFL
jgi:hypothetical protein